MRRRLLVLPVLAVVAVVAVVAVPLVARAVGSSITTPMGDQPDLTPQLTIRAPAGVVHPGDPIPVVVEYVNFHADPAARCAPAGACLGSLPNRVTGTPAVDVGHVHVYFTPGTASTEGPVQAVSFCIPTTVAEVGFAGTLSGTCPPLAERGEYRVSAEFQSDSHVSSLKAVNSPQHVPVSDVAVVRVA
jgi:hypothetical protein